MFEIEARGGLGGRGTWSRAGRTLSPPLVLFLHRSGRPAPHYAEALVVSVGSEGLRRRVRVGGSRVSPRRRRRLPSAWGLSLPPGGVVPMSDADRAACGCPAWTTGGHLHAHNDHALHREVLPVRNHLAPGPPRELAERRLANAPWNTA